MLLLKLLNSYIITKNRDRDYNILKEWKFFYINKYHVE